MKIVANFLAALCAFSLSHAFAQTADTIYHNGAILTMAGQQPAYVEALAVKDGKIALAGSKDSALQMKGAATRLVDLDGRALLPGFLDAHSHYINSLLVANQCKLYAPPSGPGKDVPAIIATLKSFAKERGIPKGEMIMGYGYDDTVMPEGRLLNRDDLDLAFPNNPVRIDHVSMHGAVMNSLALERYGIGADTKTPPGGVIVRKPGTDEPYGLIMETAFLPVLEQAEAMTVQQEIDWTIECNGCHQFYPGMRLEWRGFRWRCPYFHCGERCVVRRYSQPVDGEGWCFAILALLINYFSHRQKLIHK